MPFHTSTSATQLRILGPGVAQSVTKVITNLFKGSGSQIFKSGGFSKSGQTLARSSRSISNANKQANPKPTNAPRTGPSVSSVAKAGIIGGSAVGTSIAFTQIIGDLTKPNPAGGTVGADIIKTTGEAAGGITEVAGNITSFFSENPGTILLLGGGILLILLIK